MKYRILITGSRDWVDVSAVYGALNQVMSILGTDLVIVHGGAKGADDLAGGWANLQGVEEEVHTADWDQYGKRAGFVRNAEMVNAGADFCLAFIRNGSKGATMTRDLAQKAGIRTVTIEETS